MRASCKPVSGSSRRLHARENSGQCSHKRGAKPMWSRLLPAPRVGPQHRPILLRVNEPAGALIDAAVAGGHTSVYLSPLNIRVAAQFAIGINNIIGKIAAHDAAGLFDPIVEGEPDPGRRGLCSRIVRAYAVRNNQRGANAFGVLPHPVQRDEDRRGPAPCEHNVCRMKQCIHVVTDIRVARPATSRRKRRFCRRTR